MDPTAQTSDDATVISPANLPGSADEPLGSSSRSVVTDEIADTNDGASQIPPVVDESSNIVPTDVTSNVMSTNAPTIPTDDTASPTTPHLQNLEDIANQQTGPADRPSDTADQNDDKSYAGPATTENGLAGGLTLDEPAKLGSDDTKSIDQSITKDDMDIASLSSTPLPKMTTDDTSKPVINQPSDSSSIAALINPEHFYSIGEAAQLLHVSIDTLRRWEQKGTITAHRTAGKLRRFKGQELIDYLREAQNQDTLLPISDVAKKLGVSIQTLRRWDKSGRLRAERAPDGARMYTSKVVKEIVANGVPQEKGQEFRPPKAAETHSQDIPASNTSPTDQKPEDHEEKPEPHKVMEREVRQSLEPQHEYREATPQVHHAAPHHDSHPTTHYDQHAPSHHENRPEHVVHHPAFSSDPLIRKTEILDTKALEVLSLHLSKHEPEITPPEKDRDGNVTRPPIEDHGANAAGNSVMPKGTNKVVIKTSSYRKGSLVFVTPTSATIEQLCVPIAIDREGFAVVSAQIVPQDILFNWIVIAVAKS